VSEEVIHTYWKRTPNEDRFMQFPRNPRSVLHVSTVSVFDDKLSNLIVMRLILQLGLQYDDLGRIGLVGSETANNSVYLCVQKFI
jgi:hypothetical protein